MRLHKRNYVLIALVSLLGAASVAQALPTLTIGTASGAGGTTVTVPVTFDPSTSSITGVQFNLTLPASLSTGTVTPGAILTAAGKQVSTNLIASTWTFIVFGLNQTAISSGTLLTAQMLIAPGTALGTLNIPVTNVLYSDANGNSVPPGTSTGGSVTVTPPTPVITSSPTASGTVGVAFNYTITASNSPTSFNAIGLPSGLSINTATGLISGTPVVAGTSTVTLSATNAGGTGSLSLALTINNPLPTLTSINPSTATAGGSAFTLTAIGTNFVNGSLIQWKGSSRTTTFVNNTTLTASILASDIASSGTASVTVFSAAPGGGSSNALTFTINPPPPVITSTGSAIGQVGILFNYQITATNSPTSYGASGLPGGLAINTTSGQISGTPTSSGTVTVTLSATNAGGTGSKILSLTINPATPVITSANTATGTVGVAFNYTITASNSPTSFNATGLPSGLSINTATGLITGTPVAAGTSTVVLSATNAGGTGNLSLALTINNPLPTLTSISPSTATAGGAAFTLTATGTNFVSGSLVLWNGSSRVTTFVNNSTLTAAILATDIASSGTASVTVLNAAPGGGTSNAITFTIIPQPPVITNPSTASGKQWTNFILQILATNNPTSYNAIGLPSGLAINTTTGQITGAPSAAGTFNATLDATNAGGTGMLNLTLTVLPICDANSDGAVNVLDIQLEVNMALGITSCTADINRDGLCNILDVQRIVNAALGGACVSP